MKFGIISIFPEMLKKISSFGIINKALKYSKVSIDYFNPRDYTTDNYRSIDDYDFGGGSGMIMKYIPISKAIEAAKNVIGLNSKIIYLSAQGILFNHTEALKLLKYNSLIFICGRYKGIDERIIQDYVDEEISIGHFILSGGELPAMVIMDCLIRLLPYGLVNKESIVGDSFYNGLLDHPHYTRPYFLPNSSLVPNILLSGNHKAISKWRHKQKLIKTFKRCKSLIDYQNLPEEDKNIINSYKLLNGDK